MWRQFLEHLIQTVSNQTLILKCIGKELKLAEFFKRAGEIEDVSMQISYMQQPRAKP